MPAEPEVEGGEVEASTLSKLEGVDRADAPLGRAALALARRIDLADRYGRETGSGMAALVRQLEATLGAATVNTAREQSALDRARDELAARRARRGA